MQNLNGKADLVNLIQTTWAPSYYAAVKENLVLAGIFEREYEGIISARGDKVKVNQIIAPDAETLTNDKVEFGSKPIQVNQFELEINRQTVNSVEITNLALLQSQAFMEELKNEMAFKLALKMEQEIIAYYKAQVTGGQIVNPLAASDYAAGDIAKMRTLASRAKLPLAGRFMILSPEYYGDLLTKNQIISTDFVEGKPFMDQKIPNLLGFNIAESNALAVDTGMVFHKSCLQLAMQKSVTFDIVSQKANNKLSYSVVADFVWDMKFFDSARAWYIKEA